MRNWSMYEIEETLWEEISNTEDNPVSVCVHGSVDDGDSNLHEKKRQEIETPNLGTDKSKAYRKADEINGHSSLNDGECPQAESPSNLLDLSDAFPAASHCQYINEASSVPSSDCRKSVNYFDGHQVNTQGNGFCEDKPIVGNAGLSNVSHACDLSPYSMSSENKRLGLKKNGTLMETGLLDCEWDEIGDFNLFRNNETKFGSGSTGPADEFSWFSSPCTIDGQGVAYEFNFQSSHSELNALNDSSKLYGDNMNFLLDDKPLAEVCGHSSFANCTDAKWMDASIKDMGSVKLPKGQHKSEGGMKDWSSDLTNGPHHLSDFSQLLEGQNGHFSSFSSYQTYPSFIDPGDTLPRVDSFNSAQPFTSHAKMENGHLSQKDCVKVSIPGVESERASNIYPSYEASIPSHSCNEQAPERLIGDSSKCASTTDCTIDKISHKMQSISHRVEESNKHLQQNKSFVCRNGRTSDAELAEESVEFSKFEVDDSTVGEKNIISALCDDAPLGSTCFMKLQDVLDQLDSTTKLCMRDGLYRLARNAELRGICSSSGTPIQEESNQPSEHLVETGTNPIDRSIAQLLFYRASDSSANPINHDIKH